MASYATMKGRAASAVPAEQQQIARQPVSEQEAMSIQSNKEFVLENMPGAVQFIRDLHAEGLIDGWRNVKNCRFTGSNQ